MVSDSIVVSHQVPAASKAMSRRSNGCARWARRVEAIDVPEDRLPKTLRQRLALNDALQPISPRLSGESGTHVDISCAAAVFVVNMGDHHRLSSSASLESSTPRRSPVRLPFLQGHSDSPG